MPDTGGRIQPAPTNLNTAERTLSMAVGSALVWRALGAGVLGPFLMTVGGAMLMWRAINGFCPVKQRLMGKEAPAPQRDEPASGEPATAGRRRSRRGASDDAVHRASEDSFPASDPPSWTASSGPVSRH